MIHPTLREETRVHQYHLSTPAPATPPCPRLTRRERDVISALCRPLTEHGVLFADPPPVRTIATELKVSESAVKKHLANLYDKFDLQSHELRRRPRLASEVVRRGALARTRSHPRQPDGNQRPNAADS
jgi:DNA-binding NarL/FixJ family response regulator